MRKSILLILIFLNSIFSFAQKGDTLAKDIWKFRGGYIADVILPIKQKRIGSSIGESFQIRMTKKTFLYPNWLISFFPDHYSSFEISTHLLIKPFGDNFKPIISFGPNYKTSRGFFGEVALGLDKLITNDNTLGCEIRYSYNNSSQYIYVLLHYRGIPHW